LSLTIINDYNPNLKAIKDKAEIRIEDSEIS